MRGETKTQQRFIAQFIAQRQPLAQVILGVGSVRRGELDDDQSQPGAHAGVARRTRGRLREEIHVVEAGHAAAQHFRAGEPRAVVDELFRHMLHLGRPDVLIEPVHQREVVGEPAHQRHGGVRMEVD